MDEYQERYMKHQQSKRKALFKIMKDRHSDRMFDNGDIEDGTVRILLEATKYCPSSCNRKAVNIVVIDSRDDKALLGGHLVGGVGWIHRASKILLLFADPIAYKAPGEIEYMPYLDAGVVIQQLYLMSTYLGLACCYANPNVREENKPFFAERFGKDIFCGAFAVGRKWGE